ncbi:Proton-dependent oligopeptide transporter family [Corchorus olitorius]|uniref:Proton-dependent oligopeptide transporter family n=1 Tax=Corchorus olitorius TaxID=93759 RepID=A0A1R3J9C4_9ROSI|nr:Proton-dependent oligopeptide transporter family [Corchorus olitorius]
MSTLELQQPSNNAMDGSVSNDKEANISSSVQKKGGWITFPFIAATLAGLLIGGWGWVTNLIVYLIEEFHIKSIDATQIANVLNGCLSMIPIVAAIIADSFLSSFTVVVICTGFAVLGTVFLTLTATLDSLRPQLNPTKVQLATLYAALTLATIGLGAPRFTLATMGANQLDKAKDQGVFFNWFYFVLFGSAVISSTVIVYVEDSISWRLGFGLCAAANFVALLIFLLGNRFYRPDKPQGSPFTGLARVIVATFHKRNVKLSSKSEDYYLGNDKQNKIMASMPTKSFRFLNRAAQKSEGDINSDGSVAKPWRLCTIQQVEDLKTLIRIFPIWTTTIFLSTPIAIQANMVVLQALAMDRHLGPKFKIPAGSFLVIVLLSNCLTLALMDRFILPAWQKLTGKSLTPLQRVGIGHGFNVLSMAISALVEAKRLKIAHDQHLQDQNGAIVPMLGLWLFPQLVVQGIGEAFHFPSQITLYYQDFPVSLKGTATALVSAVIGVAYYVSTALVDLIRNVTGWLPDDINHGRLDNLYWTLVVIGMVNLGYFLVCASFYQYQNVGKEVQIVDGETSQDA